MNPPKNFGDDIIKNLVGVGVFFLIFRKKSTIALGAESGGGLKFEAGFVEMLRWFANKNDESIRKEASWT